MTAPSDRPRASLSSGARIWLFTGTLFVAAIPLAALARGDRAAYLGGFQLPWLVLALAYAAAELAVVHLYFRRDTHSFSMSETALVMGLLLAAPRSLLLAQLVGCGAVLVYRRQPAVKLCFNLANFMFGTSCAITVFRLLSPSPGHLGTRVWLAAFCAALVSNVLNGTMVVTAISLSEATVELRRMPTVMGLAMASALTNASLALIAVSLMHTDTRATWLLGVPAITMYLAYRAYLRERHKHESLEFLYQSTRILNETPELEDAIVRLLQQARGMFHAEDASVTFTSQGRMVRTAVSADGRNDLMQPVSDPGVQAVWRRLSTDGRSCAVLRRPEIDLAIDDFLATAGLRDAMVGVLHGDTGPYGLLVVGNRMGQVTSFGAGDLRLFETLASHASVTLENGRLEQSLAQLRDLERRLSQLAYHDSLTGLANRALFTDRVEAALVRRSGTGTECAVLFIDLDDFKTVNDTLGHATGDQLLRAVGERLVGCLRPEDTAARFGGDEFAVLVEDVTTLASAERVADRIAEALRRPVRCGNHEVPIRASVGIAPSTGFSTAPELLRNADVAMYMAKAEGKGSYRLFEPGMQADVAHRHQLKADLARAVEHAEFEVYYQPIIHLQSGRPAGFEALLRWHHPTLGLLTPDSFIAMAEETGLIVPIGAEVLRTATAQLAEWQQLFRCERPLEVAVNLSPAQVRTTELVGEVATALTLGQLPPGSLVLEITEGLVLDDDEPTLATLHRLRELGVRLALDDFGTGYSSLSQLRRLPIDLLKVAKTFIDDIDGGGGAAFPSAILALGNTLGLATVAEGVEHPAQVSELRRLGCTLGQGYHFGRPMPASEAEAFLRRTLRPAAGVHDRELAQVIRFPA